MVAEREDAARKIPPAFHAERLGHLAVVGGGNDDAAEGRARQKPPMGDGDGRLARNDD